MPDRVKQWVMHLVEVCKALLARVRARFGLIDHGMKTQERYTVEQGNVFAASLTYRTVLALVPVIMVAFAIGGYVLASRPDVIASMQQSIVNSVPGDLGTQLNKIMTSAIESRATVGVIGLLAAAFTGIGWMTALRGALTQMWGGQPERNAVLSKVFDLGMFLLLGLAFLVTVAISALGDGRLLRPILSWVGLSGEGWVPYVVKIIAYVVSISASTVLFTVVLSKIPLVDLPFRRALIPGLVVAVVFEVVKAGAGIYFSSVTSSPAGVAFGPILGLMVISYLAARILLYASAWCATAAANEELQIPDQADATPPPVRLSPVYDVHPMPDPKTVLAGVGVGAIVGYLWRARRRDERLGP
ncbi:inner membrane protein YhjD [Gordonia sp. TBRC 11910]|uniref:Inner membrane protein YhjD n=1 Tax=Gordonia asplenii TaxID=2725283 RepID=A0A848KX54_9ACTN|nr:YhjD/YihY/BrkB family envelope integrity protein [Gordonia asplenii]NMO01033.1 inner membrane protein YhjD [Gordonia asplenii]